MPGGGEASPERYKTPRFCQTLATTFPKRNERLPAAQGPLQDQNSLHIPLERMNPQTRMSGSEITRLFSPPVMQVATHNCATTPRFFRSIFDFAHPSTCPPSTCPPSTSSPLDTSLFLLRERRKRGDARTTRQFALPS